MKSVLISIQPKWCELIANGKKTIEVRKTAPKLQTPFKCYIYCTKAKEKLFTVMKDGDENYGGTYHGKPIFIKFEDGNSNDMYFKRQKVIGEFVCDRIESIFNVATTDWNLLCGSSHEYDKELVRQACLTEAEVHAYAKDRNTLYCWHVSNLKIYDTPKELSGFYPYKGSVWDKCKNQKCHTSNFDCYKCMVMPLTRPPQSWCYVVAV